MKGTNFFGETNYQISLQKKHNLNRILSLKETEFVVKNPPTKQTPNSNGSTGEFYQTFTEEIIPILYKVSQKTANEGIFSKSFRTAIALIQTATLIKSQKQTL